VEGVPEADVRRSVEEIEAVRRAKARLDRLGFYPSPVRIGRVRLLSVPWVFRLPWFRRFHGYTLWPAVILLRDPLAEVSDDLIVHELCHVWQMQHHPIAMPLSYLWRGYANNPNEIEARAAAASRPLPAED
jgi:hypothetical protein